MNLTKTKKTNSDEVNTITPTTNKMKTLSNIQITEAKEIKYILDQLLNEAMTLGRLKNLCKRRHNRLFGYEIPNTVVEGHVDFLLKNNIIETGTKTDGDGWNTSYTYEVLKFIDTTKKR